MEKLKGSESLQKRLYILVRNTAKNIAKTFFFTKKSIWKWGNVIGIIKIRTMEHGSDTKKIKPEERKKNGHLHTNNITSLGKKLRKLKIDEIPQIINLIKWDIALWGASRARSKLARQAICEEYYDMPPWFKNDVASFMKSHPHLKRHLLLKPGLIPLALYGCDFEINNVADILKAEEIFFEYYIRDPKWTMDKYIKQLIYNFSIWKINRLVDNLERKYNTYIRKNDTIGKKTYNAPNRKIRRPPMKTLIKI